MFMKSRVEGSRIRRWYLFSLLIVREIMKTKDSRYCRVIYSQDRALYWYFLWRWTCSNAEWGPINRDEIISHIDTADLPLYWLGSCGLDGELNCKMWNWISIILTISPSQSVNGCLQGFCKHSKLCGQQLYSPCFIDLTIQSWGRGFPVINTADNGDMWLRSDHTTKCWHSQAQCSGCLVRVDWGEAGSHVWFRVNVWGH